MNIGTYGQVSLAGTRKRVKELNAQVALGHDVAAEKQERKAVGEHLNELDRAMTIDYHNIITIEPGKRSGKPCIRDLRITVYDILEYFASGMTEQEILEDFDYLTQDDIRACFAYAADREKHSLVISS